MKKCYIPCHMIRHSRINNPCLFLCHVRCECSGKSTFLCHHTCFLRRVAGLQEILAEHLLQTFQLFFTKCSGFSGWFVFSYCSIVGFAFLVMIRSVRLPISRLSMNFPACFSQVSRFAAMITLWPPSRVSIVIGVRIYSGYKG